MAKQMVALLDPRPNSYLHILSWIEMFGSGPDSSGIRRSVSVCNAEKNSNPEFVSNPDRATSKSPYRTLQHAHARITRCLFATMCHCIACLFKSSLVQALFATTSEPCSDPEHPALIAAGAMAP